MNLSQHYTENALKEFDEYLPGSKVPLTPSIMLILVFRDFKPGILARSY